MNKKSALLTFCFACFPGAGQMYLGYMKRGLSLMMPFWGVIFLANFFNTGLLIVLLPVIWAYAFFDTFNLRAQTPEQVVANPDGYLYDIEGFMGKNWNSIIARRHSLFGGVLILFGLYVMYNTFVMPFFWQISHAYNLVWLLNLMDSLPTMIVAILIILLGLYLIKGPSQHHTGSQDDYQAFRGGNAGKGNEKDE